VAPFTFIPKVFADETFTSLTADGWVERSYPTYDGCWEQTSGTDVYNSEQYSIVGQYYSATAGYKIYRLALYFDTSSLAGKNIGSAKLRLYCDTDNSIVDFNVTIQNGQPTYPHNPLVLGDYNQSHYSGDGGSTNTSTISAASWFEIDLNMDGISWINTTGVTKFILRSSKDIDKSPPSEPGSPKREQIYIASAEDVNNYYPELVISTGFEFEFEITNMEGCGDWVFAEEKYYHFQVKIVYNLGGTLDTVEIKFSDGLHWMNASASYGDETFELLSGGDYARLADGGMTTNALITIVFDFYFTAKILDAYDVDVWLYANDTLGNERSWYIIESDYFNIYNLGGQANMSSSGYGGRTTGGEAFELYAGEEGYVELFWDDFERDMIDTWGIYVANSTYVDVSMDDTDPNVYEWFSKAVKFSDESDLDNDYGLMWNYFKPVSSGMFYVTFQYMPKETTEDQSFVITNSTVGGLGGPWVYFADDNKIYYVNSTGDHIEIHSGYGARTWKNCTFYINVTDQTYDFYYEGSLKLDDGQFFSEVTSFDLLYTSTYLYDSPHTNNITNGWVDDVRVWLPPLEGNKEGSSQVTVTFRNLQHIHSLFAIGFPYATNEALGITGDWFIEWGIDYCIDDTWINNAWKVRLDLMDADVAHASFGTQGQNWIQLRARWYERNTTLIDTEYFYTFWEGGPGGLGSTKLGYRADYLRLYLDLWFNSINASTTVGGRVSSYYYGMSDKAHPWLQWLTGSDWKIAASERAQSMYFTDLEDSSGDIHSCKEITMMRIRAKVWRSSDYEYECRMEEFDLLSYTIAPGEMQGVNTPIFTETRVPSMPSGGFFAALAAVFSSLIDLLTNSLGPGLLDFLDVFVGMLDTLFTMAGWPNGFSQILSWISTFFTFMITSGEYLVDILTSLFEIVTGPLVNFISLTGSMITNTITTITGMLAQINTAFNDTAAPLLPAVTSIMTIIGVMLPFWEIVRMEQKGFQILFEDLNMVLNLFAFFISLFTKVINLVIRFTSFLIESIPVAE
jgi:hypothetical protein